MKIKVLNKDYVENMIGYRPFTTFYEDFSIAESFGIVGIVDTFENVINQWKHDYKYLTELVLILNWKMCEHYDSDNEKIAKIYNILWENALNFCYDNLKDDELSYFYRITD